MYTTLNKIKSFSPCCKGWKTLLEGLGKTEADDEPLHLLDILRINGAGDALWSLKAFSAKERQLFAIGAARQVQQFCPDSEHLLNMAEALVLQTPVNGVSTPSLSELDNHMSAVARASEAAWATWRAARTTAARTTAASEAEAEAARTTAARTMAVWAAKAAEAVARAAGLSSENVIKAACSYVESRIG